MKVLLHLLCVFILHERLLASVPNVNLGKTTVCLNSYFSHELDDVKYSIWLDQLKQASRLNHDVRLCLTTGHEKTISVRKNEIILPINALSAMRDNQTIVGMLISARILSQKLKAFKNIKIKRDYTLTDSLIAIGAILAHNAGKTPYAYDDTKGGPELDFSAFESDAHAVPNSYLLNSLFRESLAELKILYGNTSQFETYIQNNFIGQIHNYINISHNAVVLPMSFFSEALVHEENRKLEALLDISEITKRQTSSVYDQGLRTYLTVIHSADEETYLKHLEQLLVSNASVFLKKNALKVFFNRIPENRWIESIFVYEFFAKTPHALSDDLQLWQRFSVFATNLDFSTDANVAQANILALLGSYGAAEQFISEAIQQPEQGKLSTNFILKTRQNLMQNH